LKYMSRVPFLFYFWSVDVHTLF